VDAQSGNDQASGLDPANAWRTLALVQRASYGPGDSVLLSRGGVWSNESLLVSGVHGSSGSPVVLSSYGDPLAARPRVVSSGRLLDVRSSSWLVFEQLELSGARYGCLELLDSTVSHVLVQDIEAHGCGSGVVATGHDIEMRRLLVRDGKMIVNTPDIEDDDHGATGVVLSRIDGCRVTQSRFLDLSAPSFDYGADGGAVEFWRHVGNCRIDGNLAWRSNGFAEFGGLPADTARDVAIHHNIVLASGVLAVFHYRSADRKFGIGYDRVHLDHNLVVQIGGKPYGYFLVADGDRPDRADRIRVRNNIFVSDTTTYYAYEAADPWNVPAWEHTHNLLWNPRLDPFAKGWPRGEGETFADPLLASPTWRTDSVLDTAVSSWRPRSGSPARAGGPDLGYASDYLGAPGAQGGLADLGPLGVEGAARSSGRGVPSPVFRLRGRGSEAVVEAVLPEPVRLEIRVLDLRGRALAAPTVQDLPAGVTRLSLPGEPAGGLVLVRLSTGSRATTLLLAP
jgi:hypothetical protein